LRSIRFFVVNAANASTMASPNRVSGGSQGSLGISL
jgi:hypothetical protein